MDVKAKQPTVSEEEGDAVYFVHFDGVEVLAACDIGGVPSAKCEARRCGRVPDLKRRSAWECKTQASVLQLMVMIGAAGIGKHNAWRRTLSCATTLGAEPSCTMMKVDRLVHSPAYSGWSRKRSTLLMPKGSTANLSIGRRDSDVLTHWSMPLRSQE